VQFTVTGCPRVLESSVIAPDEAVAQLGEVCRRFGPRAAVWRYDPVVFAAGLDHAAHRALFTRLARQLRGTVDEVVLSVVHPYKKKRRNLDRAAARRGFVWTDPPVEGKRDLLRALAAIAAEQGIAASLYSQPELLAPALPSPPARGGSAWGRSSAKRCIDAARLADIA
jgi:hypothetical protein